MNEGARAFAEREGGVAEKGGEPLISIDESLFLEEEKVLKAATLSGEDIDNALKERFKKIDSLQKTYVSREDRLRRVENFNPLVGLISSDYDRLVKEQVIDTTSAENLKKLDAAIARLEAVKDPIPDVLATLEKLGNARRKAQEQLEHLMKEKQERVDAFREAARGAIVGLMGKKITRLEGTIAAIENNPLVRERLHTIAKEDDKKRREAKEQEEKERLEVQKRIDEKVPRDLQSVGDRHKNAFRRMGELVGDADIGEKLRAAVATLHEAERAVEAASDNGEKKKLSEEMRRADRALYNLINTAKKRLIAAAEEGEDAKQLKHPSEVVPWEGGGKAAYFSLMNFLQAKEIQQYRDGLLSGGKSAPWKEQHERISNENEALKRLFGGKFVKDRGGKKTGVLTDFYAAFETRKKNDTEGVTAARKTEREAIEKGKAEFNKNAKEIVGRGGFMVMGQQGIVRLEKVKGQKGTELWEVAEIYGKTGTLKVGHRSVLSMRGFPNWVGEAARTCFLTRGQDFVERLQYGPEDQE